MKPLDHVTYVDRRQEEACLVEYQKEK